MAKESPARGASWVVPGLFFLFLVPVMVYAGYSVMDRWYQGYRLGQEEAALRADIARLREENLRLQGELKAVRSDAFIEGVAREQLGLVKPGDKPMVLIGPTAPAAPAPRAAATEPAARRTEPAAAPAERGEPPQPSGWGRIFDALLGR